MSDLTERLRRRAETLDALSDPDITPATTATAAWKLEARLSMSTAAKDSTEAADEIDRLTRELAEAREKALEDAAKALDAWGDIYGDNAAKTVRALKEKP